MKLIETDPLCECGHAFGDHGDRAVTACMGGWQGPAAPFMVPRCPCQGYKAGSLRRRRAA